MSITGANTDIVQQFVTSLENNDLERAANYLAADFLFSGWTPMPLEKEAFLKVIGGLKAGLPDLRFDLRNLHKRREQVVVGTIQVTGTQTDSVNLPELGLPLIPQTAGHVSLPDEDVMFEILDGQITQMMITPARGGDLHGFIRQLGIDVPIIQ